MSKRRRRNRPHLYIMRGIPGSRKSKIAREIQESYGTGVILSTDDYFRDENGTMHFDWRQLQEAHDWNRDRAYWALLNQQNPVIIDNTNIRRWEMKPYVEMGLRFRYYIQFLIAPDTRNYRTEELYRRNKGLVPLQVMENMKRRFEVVNDIYDVLHS